jgi:hypothetical protein
VWCSSLLSINGKDEDDTLVQWLGVGETRNRFMGFWVGVTYYETLILLIML